MNPASGHGYAPGMVVLADLFGAVQTKRRPTIVVSSDFFHATHGDVTAGLLTTVQIHSGGPTDYLLQDWRSAGLHQPSLFRVFLQTMPPRRIVRVIGRLSDRDWQEV
jgi:mRNA interferase MazF